MEGRQECCLLLRWSVVVFLVTGAASGISEQNQLEYISETES